MNMSYCRFHNTAQAYRDCLEAINDSEEMEDISKDEEHAMIELISLSQQLLDVVRERLNLSEHVIIDPPSVKQWVENCKYSHFTA